MRLPSADLALMEKHVIILIFILCPNNLGNRQGRTSCRYISGAKIILRKKNTSARWKDKQKFNTALIRWNQHVNPYLHLHKHEGMRLTFTADISYISINKMSLVSCFLSILVMTDVPNCLNPNYDLPPNLPKKFLWPNLTRLWQRWFRTKKVRTNNHSSFQILCLRKSIN